MTFKAWLRTQKRRDDPVGDFARDALEDRRFPRVSTDTLGGGWTKVRRHLQAIGACDSAEDAGFQAWREYQRAAAETSA